MSDYLLPSAGATGRGLDRRVKSVERRKAKTEQRPKRDPAKHISFSIGTVALGLSVPWISPDDITLTDCFVFLTGTLTGDTEFDVLLSGAVIGTVVVPSGEQTGAVALGDAPMAGDAVDYVEIECVSMGTGTPPKGIAQIRYR